MGTLKVYDPGGDFDAQLASQRSSEKGLSDDELQIEIKKRSEINNLLEKFEKESNRKLAASEAEASTVFVSG